MPVSVPSLYLHYVLFVFVLTFGCSKDDSMVALLYLDEDINSLHANSYFTCDPSLVFLDIFEV